MDPLTGGAARMKAYGVNGKRETMAMLSPLTKAIRAVLYGWAP